MDLVGPSLFLVPCQSQGMAPSALVRVRVRVYVFCPVSLIHPHTTDNLLSQPVHWQNLDKRVSLRLEGWWGHQRCSEERVQWTLFRAKVMTNGAGLWEPALGGRLWLNMSVSPHTIVPFPISDPPPSSRSLHPSLHPPLWSPVPANPPPGRRQHIPSLSIDEEGERMIYLFIQIAKTRAVGSSGWNHWWLMNKALMLPNWLWKTINKPRVFTTCSLTFIWQTA